MLKVPSLDKGIALSRHFRAVSKGVKESQIEVIPCVLPLNGVSSDGVVWVDGCTLTSCMDSRVLGKCSLSCLERLASKWWEDL